MGKKLRHDGIWLLQVQQPETDGLVLRSLHRRLLPGRELYGKKDIAVKLLNKILILHFLQVTGKTVLNGRFLDQQVQLFIMKELHFVRGHLVPAVRQTQLKMHHIPDPEMPGLAAGLLQSGLAVHRFLFGPGLILDRGKILFVIDK